jgi:hypothetical protein
MVPLVLAEAVGKVVFVLTAVVLVLVQPFEGSVTVNV